MRKIFNKKQDVIFLGVALFLLVLVILYAALAVSFLARNIESALFGAPTQGPLITHFNFDKVNQVLAGREMLPAAP